MKLLRAVFLSVIIAFFLFSCDTGNSSNLLVYEENGVFGLKKGGRVICKPIYSSIAVEHINNDIIIVGQGNTFGLVDTNGVTIVACEYDTIEILPNNTFIVEQNTLKSVIDRYANVLLPMEFTNILYDTLHYYSVEKDKKWGIAIPTPDSVLYVVPLLFDYLKNLDNVHYYTFNNNKSGLVTKDGLRILDTKYDEVVEIGAIPKEDLKLFRFTENGKQGIILSTGRIIIPPTYDFIEPYVNKIARVKENDKWGFIGIRGEILLQPKYDELNQFTDEGDASYIMNGDKGVIVRHELFTAKEKIPSEN